MSILASPLRLCAFLTAAAVLCAGLPARADTFSDAKTAYGQRDFATAAKLFHQLAAQGNPVAQQFLGFMYHDGEGVPKDLERSYMWFELALSLFPPDGQDFHDTAETIGIMSHELTRIQIDGAHAMARACQSRNYKECE